MKRREFITLVGGAAAWSLAAQAQQGDRRRVGMFMDLAEQDREGQTRVAAFREGMQKLGWIEGVTSPMSIDGPPVIPRLWNAMRPSFSRSSQKSS